MKTYNFKYGHGSVSLSLNEADILAELHGTETPPISDIRSALFASLEQPIDSAPLRQRVRPGDRVALVISDMTRFWMRQDLVVPHLVDYLTQRCGVRERDITIVIANGTHTGGDEAELRRFVANSIWLSAAFAVVLTVATALLCTPVLRWMNTPDNIFRYAYDYIFVIFLGIPAIILYNLVSGVIRSLGDSRTPIYFLVLSSLLNVALDLLAVAVLGMGVEGPAWATVISQAISGLLCLAIMGKRYPVLRFRPGELRPSRTHITRLFAIGVPMGLQYSVTAIGTIVVQTAVNGLGAVSIAAVTAANKVSQLFTCPFDAAGTTMAVYGGQNYGAMKLDRIHRGVRACVLLMFAYSALGLGVLALFGGKLSLLFLDSAESAAVRDQIGLLAQQFLVWNASCYFLLTLVNVLRFLIQGVGFTQQAVFAGVFETIARCFVGFAVVRWIGYTAICLANPAAWLLADCFLVPIYFHDMHILQRRFAQRRAEA